MPFYVLANRRPHSGTAARDTSDLKNLTVGSITREASKMLSTPHKSYVSIYCVPKILLHPKASFLKDLDTKMTL